MGIGPPAGRCCRVCSGLHPGVTLEEVRRLAGLAFAVLADLPESPVLDAEARGLLYGPVRDKLARAYPHFAARL